jgi:hypothetical protein
MLRRRLLDVATQDQATNNLFPVLLQQDVEEGEAEGFPGERSGPAGAGAVVRTHFAKPLSFTHTNAG